MLKESLDYVRQYGLIRLFDKASGHLYRTIRPVLYSAGLIKDSTVRTGVGLQCFYVPQSPPRLNLVMTAEDASDYRTDQILKLIMNLADRTGYGLRVLSGSPFDTLKFSRLLKTTGFQTGNVEFACLVSARSNSEIDIGPLDVFVACSPDASARIEACVAASNIIPITSDQVSQADSSDTVTRLVQQVSRIITDRQSGGYHV